MLDVGEVRLRVLSQGERQGRPPVVLLHGFPEFAYSWRHQMEALAQAGFQAVAPDLRGYNLSDKPRGIASYHIDKLAADVAGLARALAAPRIFLVGHDWGGAIAWHVAARHPELIERLAILNAPHPRVMARLVRSRRGLRQLRRSWYMLYFQLPLLPERMVLSPEFLPRALRGTSVRKGTFTDEDLARYRAALTQPGAATAAINYYRAVVRDFFGAERIGAIEAPTLVLWGEQDAFLGTELLDELPGVVPRLRVERFADAGHWIQQEQPGRVSDALLEFFA